MLNKASLSLSLSLIVGKPNFSDPRCKLGPRIHGNYGKCILHMKWVENVIILECENTVMKAFLSYRNAIKQAPCKMPERQQMLQCMS